jgi:hypothetical protein
MVRRSVFPWTVATLALLGIRVADAAPISLTGHVAQDFDPNTNPSVQKFTIDTDPFNMIYHTPYMVQNNLVTGWAVKDLRMAFDAGSNTLSVGLNTYGVAGDADGNGDPGSVSGSDPNFAHGLDQPHLGGQKSITVALAANNPGDPTQHGTPILVAGVSADKAAAGIGTDGFNVAQFAGINAGIQNNYGATLAGHVGALAFDPSGDHPNFEFTITQFSTIAGLDPSAGFWVKVYAGSPDDGSVGEESSQWIRVPAFAPQTIPEPATWLAWSLLAGGAAWARLRGKGPAR